jgi:hypothetical protein
MITDWHWLVSMYFYKLLQIKYKVGLFFIIDFEELSRHFSEITNPFKFSSLFHFKSSYLATHHGWCWEIRLWKRLDYHTPPSWEKKMKGNFET